MNRQRGRNTRIVVALSVLAVLAGAVLVVSAVLYYRYQQVRMQNEPPSVTITYPASGVSTLAGGYLPVSATAFGATPITRLELWVDGEPTQVKDSSAPEGISPFYATFDLTVSQGLHTLFVRAVDAVGLMGDSWPVNVGGVERPGPNDPALLVTVEEGQTVDDLAAAYQVDPEIVRELNPGLGDQEPAEGSEVVLPLPPSEAAPETEGPAVGPELPTGEGEQAGGVTETPPTGVKLALAEVPAPIDIRPLLDLLRSGSPPAAPTDLRAEVEGCNISLSWKDNADNEERYEVWYLWNLGQDPRVIAELEPAAGGQALFEFPAPSDGAFIVWVEAVNFWGSQASNKVGALVAEGDCPQSLATHLQVQLLGMSMPGDYKQVYCYLSFEGAPNLRVPESGYFDDWVQIVDLWGDNVDPWLVEQTRLETPAPSEENTLAIPIPGDQSLEAHGECLAWAGGKLTEIGTVSGQYPQQTWDGSRLTLAGAGLELGLSIKPLAGALDTSGQMTTFSYDDPKMPIPYEVAELAMRPLGIDDPLLRTLIWRWDGDRSTISGFQILLNGVPYTTGGGWSLVDPHAPSALVRLPSPCGQHIRWQVRAVAGQAQSGLSALSPLNDYDLPQCPEYAMVFFNKISFQDDCNFNPAWLLSVNGQVKAFKDDWECGSGSCMVRGGFLTNCGPHYFYSWGAGMDPYPNTIVVPITLGEIDVEVKAVVWDIMSGDIRAADYEEYHFPSLEAAQQKVGCGWRRDYPVFPDRGWIWYTLYIFPQAQGLDCPNKEPAYIP